MTSVQPQMTSIQPQFTSFNPYAQQMEQQHIQEEYLRQQQEWRLLQQQQEQQRQQQEEWQRQQILQQQQQQQQEEWLRQQQALQLQQQQQQQKQQQWQQQQFLQQQQQQLLQPQHTAFGSKNPFAFTQSPNVSAPPQPFPAFSASPPVPTPASPEPPSPTTMNTRANARRPFVDDGKNAHLASLIANKCVLCSCSHFPNFDGLRLRYQRRRLRHVRKLWAATHGPPTYWTGRSHRSTDWFQSIPTKHTTVPDNEG